MGNLHHTPDPPNQPDDELDRVLDAALAHYSSVEPRAGLEERILANLRSAEVTTRPNWWHWSLSLCAVAILILAVALAWKVNTPSRQLIANQPAITKHGPSGSGANIRQRDPGTIETEKNAVRHRRQIRTATVAAIAPRLAQFPSAQPLTEQERILASYVVQFHDQAVLVARLADEEIQKDRIEIMGRDNSSGFDEDADQTKSR